jgi:hypothetical protein
MQGLRQYFQLCNNSEGIAVATPSRVVDAAWHEFILMTRSYEQFCIKAFGRFLHHMPARDEQTSNVISNGMMNALAADVRMGADQTGATCAASVLVRDR